MIPSRQDIRTYYKNITYNSGNPELLRAAQKNGSQFATKQFNIANTHSTGIVLDLYLQDPNNEKFYIVKDMKIGRGYNVNLLDTETALTFSDDMDLYTKISTSSGTATVIFSCVSQRFK